MTKIIKSLTLIYSTLIVKTMTKALYLHCIYTFFIVNEAQTKI